MLAAGDHVRAFVCPCRPLNVQIRMLKQTLKLMGSLYSLSNIKHIKLKHLDTRNECLSVRNEKKIQSGYCYR